LHLCDNQSTIIFIQLWQKMHPSVTFIHTGKDFGFRERWRRWPTDHQLDSPKPMITVISEIDGSHIIESLPDAHSCEQLALLWYYSFAGQSIPWFRVNCKCFSGVMHICMDKAGSHICASSRHSGLWRKIEKPWLWTNASDFMLFGCVNNRLTEMRDQTEDKLFGQATSVMSWISRDVRTKVFKE
jgi:hypothetical protein